MTLGVSPVSPPQAPVFCLLRGLHSCHWPRESLRLDGHIVVGLGCQPGPRLILFLSCAPCVARTACSSLSLGFPTVKQGVLLDPWEDGGTRFRGLTTICV